LHFGISVALACHFLKHPINHANMEVHISVQAGPNPVDESHGAHVQGRLVDGPKAEITALGVQVA
jgi:hypothetical protein